MIVRRFSVDAVCAVSLLLWAACAAAAPPWQDAQWVPIGENSPPPENGENAFDIQFEEGKGDIVVEFRPGGSWRRTRTIGDDQYLELDLPGAAQHQAQGFPALPVVTVHLVVGAASPDAIPYEDLIESSWSDSGVVLPSRGAVRGEEDLLHKPYRRGAFYTSQDVFPNRPVTVSRPFTYRELRGVTLSISPFQYEADSGRLRVVSRLRLRLDTREQEGAANSRRAPLHPEFVPSYRSTFLNFAAIEELIDEPAAAPIAPLLIITPAAWVDALRPFINWKRQKGIDVFVQTIEVVGNTQAEIKQTVRDYYEDEQIGHVILVGDNDRIVTHRGDTGYAVNNEADPVYGLLSDGDHWPEVVVSRVSLDSADRVAAFLNRCVNYELHPSAETAWYQRTQFTAGHLNNYCSWMSGARDKLHDDLHHQVGKVCSHGDAARTQVVDFINDGASLVFYFGHGDRWSWQTTNFSTADVAGLLNGCRLPFVVAGACWNGDFAEDDCLAETWIDSEAARGAIGALAASTSMVDAAARNGVQRIVGDLVANPSPTAGTHWYGALAYHATDEVGQETFEMWNHFGDSTLQLRTAAPTPIDDSGVPSTLARGASSVTFTTDPGVAVGIVKWSGPDCVLLGGGSANDDGNVTITLTTCLAEGDDVLITLSGRNRIPVQRGVGVE